MKKKDKYRTIAGQSFVLGFNNPSPGSPEIKMFEFDDHFLYATWEDGDKTKTKIDKMEKTYEDNEETGIKLWFGEDFIYLSRIVDDNGDEIYTDDDEDEDDDDDDEEGEMA